MSTDSQYDDLDYLVYLFAINLICNFISKYNKDNNILINITSNVLENCSDSNIELVVPLDTPLNLNSMKQISPVLYNSFETKCFILTIKSYYCFCHKVFQNTYMVNLFKKLDNIIFNNPLFKNWFHIIPNISQENLEKINSLIKYDISLDNPKCFSSSTIDNNYYYNSFTTITYGSNNLLIGLNSAYLNTTYIINLCNNQILNITAPNIKSISNILVFLLKLSKNIDNIKADILGKNGLLTEATKTLSSLCIEDRKIIGNFLNKLRTFCTHVFDLLKKEITYTNIYKSLSCDKLDITLPTYNINNGGLHPLTKVTEDVISIFNNIGFDVIEGPEVEIEENNFISLNFDEHHPAKNSHDTFYFSIKDNQKYLLRTHTSTVQIRAMNSYNLPIKFIAPGRVYRSDNDATHTPMFHQLEGLYISKEVSIAELKGLLTEFCEKFFNIKYIPLRFRPSYFPFTSPSLEVDIGCKITNNKIIIGEKADWLEILGCGMIHPNVLKNCNINPKEYSGFAFGMGLERLAMLKYGFPDIRDFFNSNYLWLKTYKFSVIKSLYNKL